ncbi:hypothetical protein QQF64_018651 [Cirrhinus molitorella]|uniref:Uncharacterized protein n=1 Tax=Cirrhinus molitorella TaxID=172907 RepID=A0ABR3LEU1_9TELE
MLSIFSQTKNVHKPDNWYNIYQFMCHDTTMANRFSAKSAKRVLKPSASVPPPSIRNLEKSLLVQQCRSRVFIPSALSGFTALTALPRPIDLLVLPGPSVGPSGTYRNGR